MQGPREFDSQNTPKGHIPGLMGRSPKVVDIELTPMAKRMKALRIVVAGANQTIMAKKLDITASRWNNYERNMNVSTGMAEKLIKAVPGLTWDWIYSGGTGGLTVDLHEALRRAESEIETTVATSNGKRRR